MQTINAESTAELKTCVECSGKLVLDPERGEMICGVCGVVSTAWDLPLYQLGDGASPRKEPVSNLEYDIELHTLIGTEDVRGNRNGFSNGFDRLRRINNFTITRDTKISNGMRAMNEINTIVGAMNLPASVSREAQEIYRKGLNNGVMKGKSISSFSAACVLLACKIVGVSCSSADMEHALSSINGKAARRNYRLLVRSMNYKLDYANPASHVTRIAAKAGLSVTTARRAMEILGASADNPILADKRSSSLAAAALYIAAHELGEYTSQLRLAVAGGITPITVRKRSAELLAITSEPVSPKLESAVETA